MSTPQILLTGATGYIGGSILTLMLGSNEPILKSATITCLVRGEDRVSELKAAYGDRVKPELYKDLDDIERAIEVASQHDIVINTTVGYHPESAAALVRGLAKRKEKTGKDVYLIHTSGTSNVADRPITKAMVEDRIFDDVKDDIYNYEKTRNDSDPYGQRTSELGVIDAGIETGVKTLVIMSPTIYGIGTGMFNKKSIQVPMYMKAALGNGQAAVVGSGEGVWDNVHIEDLAELYKLITLRMLEGNVAEIPFGTKGIIFSGNGRHSWLEVAQGVADAAYDAGRIKTKEVKSVNVEEGARLLTEWFVPGGDQQLVELGLSSNSRTESNVARKLGWRPSRGKEAWKRGFTEEVSQAE
ncbi:hypothetical protein HII31_07428 [Pseudocercospora fuligena]|uniref:NAD-dependent epimerase/dehydratase domain-containing protein n=1 Tax=Pseudocercospora fuligena TaxID=685502 RepID=A0A8H6VLS3_9PEZI|nr:hypothetical protein HII31_07428 [Pseudocercospora fuligena]